MDTLGLTLQDHEKLTDTGGDVGKWAPRYVTLASGSPSPPPGASHAIITYETYMGHMPYKGHVTYMRAARTSSARDIYGTYDAPAGTTPPLINAFRRMRHIWHI